MENVKSDNRVALLVGTSHDFLGAAAIADLHRTATDLAYPFLIRPRARGHKALWGVIVIKETR